MSKAPYRILGVLLAIQVVLFVAEFILLEFFFDHSELIPGKDYTVAELLQLVFFVGMILCSFLMLVLLVVTCFKKNWRPELIRPVIISVFYVMPLLRVEFLYDEEPVHYVDESITNSSE